MNRNMILKMVVILASIVVIAGSLSRLIRKDSMTLTDYAKLNSLQTESENPNGSEAENRPSSDASDGKESKDPNDADTPDGNDSLTPENSGEKESGDPNITDSSDGTDSLPAGSSEGNDPENPEASDSSSVPDADSELTGAVLNGTSMLEQRVSLTDGFYYEPISDKLKRYMTGISYPEEDSEGKSVSPEIGFEDLRYVHILHYDFDGNPAEGELVCNEYIAQDIMEIFLELYKNQYQLEKVLLIDEYDGEDELSMEDNNTSCFNYRPVTNNASLSMHAYGLAVDINPLYNPYISYSKEGVQEVLPVSAETYADRSGHFPYKIDENDLCYRLFIQHGFTWGGNWNNVKDYQHFQKEKPLSKRGTNASAPAPLAYRSASALQHFKFSLQIPARLFRS